MELIRPFHQLASSYSDDGAMTLALAQQFIDTTPRLYDHAIAIQYFLEWWKYGRFSTTDEAWDGVKAQLCQKLANYTFTHPILAERFAQCRSVSDWTSRTNIDIKSSGWVTDTLECALWAFFKFDTWADGALAVVNLGEDSDSAGAVYGALADISYGVEAIPQRWVDSMKNADLIHEIAEKFAEKVAATPARG
ncbi:uncharacterized protein N7484_008058 [Penicillium longicatenatum]|uniref:uncharacterized protein n=1 Tax=Penicillium longicatenatum TaxID=1561947 RepID=UPI00254934EB|nr:uncharacterized protein N7484_008058 [Penicillium longicatenatum]KAJ5640196.1 hypothetical protein N7484_008058 [Penicillium longicatenatum]